MLGMDQHHKGIANVRKQFSLNNCLIAELKTPIRCGQKHNSRMILCGTKIIRTNNLLCVTYLE